MKQETRTFWRKRVPQALSGTTVELEKIGWLVSFRGWLSRRTTATLIGAVPSKLLIAGILCVEAVLVYVSFGDLLITGFLGLGAAWFLLDATVIWRNRPYSPTEMRLFMWGWNAAAFAGMFWNWTKGSLLHVGHFAGL